MEWLGDTEEVKKLINELLKSEDLINVYSEDYFQKRKQQMGCKRNDRTIKNLKIQKSKF